MGYLKDDVRNLQGDLVHVQKDINKFKVKLNKNELKLVPLAELLALGDFLAHVCDLEMHIKEVSSHVDSKEKDSENDMKKLTGNKRRQVLNSSR